MEKTVSIKVRPKDVEIAKKAAEAAAKTYNELSGRDVEYDVEGSLNDDRYVEYTYLLHLTQFRLLSAGGIKLVNGGRRITVDNTLDERLHLLEDRVGSFCVSMSSNLTSIPMLPDVARDSQRSLWPQREPKILQLNASSMISELRTHPNDILLCAIIIPVHYERNRLMESTRKFMMTKNAFQKEGKVFV
jgi:hypothetical protein